MAGATWRLPSSPEEWFEALDRSTAESQATLSGLNQAVEARRLGLRQGLDAAVASLSVEGAPSGDASLSDGRPWARDGVPAGRPFVPLPRRTTHGGPWGPAVAAKLRDEAMGRRRW